MTNDNFVGGNQNIGYMQQIHPHEHGNECDHSLKFCGRCDVVYCLKCNKEWKQGYTQNYTYATPYNPYNGQSWCSNTAGSYNLKVDETAKHPTHNGL